MILSTHIIIAAAASKPVLHNPVLVFLISIASHFILDMIPHWEYKLRSVDVNPENIKRGFVRQDASAIAFDLLRIALDIFVGALVIFYALGIEFNIESLVLFAIIIIGAILPDALQVVYWLFPRSFMVYIQRFHKFVHSNIDLSYKPFLGITSQIFISAVAIAFIML